jgi:arylsulfatase A-like enzyme
MAMSGIVGWQAARHKRRRGRGRPGSLGAVIALLVLCAFASNIASAEQPNVIVILADDLGWTDLSCYGSDLYESPHIDQLARDGVRFTANYSACTVCSPTRAAILTGEYPARLHITDWIPGLPPGNPRLIVPDFTKHLPYEETTLAEILHDAGYATASIGKWHLGEKEFYPEHHGFDLNIAGTDAPQPRPGYFAPWEIETIEQGPQGQYITDRLGAEADNFIRDHAKEPFFLYLPHFAVHTPIQAKKPIIKKFEEKLTPEHHHQNAAYAAMIESMDATVGRLRETLDELKIADRTIIIFTSDNGGRVPTTSNAPLRYGKGSAYEGGVRVPMIVYAPGVTAAGAECDQPVITMDVLPTVLELVDLPLAEGEVCDGVSLAPLLEGNGELAERSLFWHYPHYQHYQQGGATPYGAIRQGDYKLIEFYADGKTELYNLAEDVGEQHDLAEPLAEKARQMQQELHAWLKSVDAQMPEKNPAYDPAKPEDTRKLDKKG